MGKRTLLSRFVWCALSLLLTSCGGLWGTSAAQGPVPQITFSALGTATYTPFQPEGASPVPPTDAAPLVSPVASAVPVQPTASASLNFLWISPAVPDVLRQAAITSGLPLVASSETATLRLDVLPPHSSNNNLQSSVWYYALVAPFPTITDAVGMADIRNTWAGTPSGPFSDRPLWMDEATQAAFSKLWGAPASGSVQVVRTDQLVDSAWVAQPAWAIIPFEKLEPRWKVLSVDGQSPVHNDFDPAVYQLKIPFALQPAAFNLPVSNRDPKLLTVLAMTGTTALVRATADRMELHGVLYPGEEVRSVLRAADITHVSNEISFDPDCPTPDPWTNSLQFCSNPRYIALLEDVGVDLVELTGNHLLDYGPQDMLTTLDLYDKLGLKYFGGGRDLQSALQPALFEDHGNRLAFIGCNIAGPPNDWATDNRPGSAPCNLDEMTARISSLRAQGYLVVWTFQYNEYYQSNPTPEEQVAFRRMADAGAVIVSGSQAHMPASMELYDGSFIHYGLGNLFFDQMSHLMPDGSVIYDTRNVFIDRHIIYAGRYLGTELLTYIIEDYARPRLMTGSERIKFLQHIFSAAGW